jgi:hypothetical protein
MENQVLDFSKDSKGPDLRSKKQIKEDWIRESVEYTNPNVPGKRKNFSFAPPTAADLERMKNLDHYGNPLPEVKPQTDLYGNEIPLEP